MAYINNIVLNGAETAVAIVACRYVYIRNRGIESVYASNAPGIVANGEGVLQIEPGEGAIYPDCGRTLYLLGNGAVTVMCTDSDTHYFSTIQSYCVDPVARNLISEIVTAANYKRYQISSGSYKISKEESIVAIPEGAVAAVISNYSMGGLQKDEGRCYVSTTPNNTDDDVVSLRRNAGFIWTFCEEDKNLYLSSNVVEGSVSISFYNNLDAAACALEIDVR